MSEPRDVPVRRIPMGVRAIPLTAKPDAPPKWAAETCGKGDKVARHQHLDEIDGDAFK